MRSPDRSDRLTGRTPAPASASAGAFCLALLAALLFAAGAGAVTLRPGDILVADEAAFGGDGGVIHVDPSTGLQTAVSNNAISDQDLFGTATFLALTRAGTILLTEATGGSPAVLAVNPSTGQATRVSTNAISDQDLLAFPFGIAVEADGRILVSEEQGPLGTGALVRVDPSTGQQSLVSDNAISGPDLFFNPFGMTLDRSGQPVIADLVGPNGNGAVIRVDPSTGQQTLVSDNTLSGPDLFALPVDALVRPSGRVLVLDYDAFGGDGGVIAIDPAGQQSALSNNAISTQDLLVDPFGMAFDRAGRIVVGDESANGGSGAVIRIDPATGQQTLISDNSLSGPDLFQEPGGVLVVPPQCGGQFATIVGTDGPDTLVGTPSADVIVGLDGNDTIRGGGGRDLICSGKGQDRVFGGAGADRIFGGAGLDRLLGGAGPDRLFGQGGRDRLFGQRGPDRLFGGGGPDRLFGQRGPDRLFGGAGPDRFFGGPGRDRLFGQRGRDLLVGGPGRDRLRGGPGRDRQKQ